MCQTSAELESYQIQNFLCYLETGVMVSFVVAGAACVHAAALLRTDVALHNTLLEQ